MWIRSQNRQMLFNVGKTIYRAYNDIKCSYMIFADGERIGEYKSSNVDKIMDMLENRLNNNYQEVFQMPKEE